MDNLFANKLFYLIHVDFNDEISLVKPFGNRELQKDVQKKGYRCISHVWGTADRTKNYVWKDHGVKEVAWKVEVREEKRERLLQIFKYPEYHGGYFWIDNLCIDQDSNDKPLDVMGDIYRKCKECICLLDSVCDVPGYTSERKLWMDVAKDVGKYIEGKYTESMDSKYDNLRALFKGSIPKDSFGAKYLQYLLSIRDAKWFQRVWTWQEAVLPPKLLFCSEQAGQYRYDPYDQEFLGKLFPYECIKRDMLDRMYANFEKWSSADNSSKLYIYEHIWSCITHIVSFYAERRDIWGNIKFMAVSSKQCTNKEDYVYGVIGILDISVPKGLTLDKAVKELEKGLLKYGIVGSKDWPHSKNPKNLGELYNGMEFVQERENHGRILSKEPHDNDMHEHI